MTISRRQVALRCIRHKLTIFIICIAYSGIHCPLPSSAEQPTQSQITTTIKTSSNSIDESLLLRYSLSPFDDITVTVYQQPDLSSNQRISEAGTITLPLVGEIKISGLTTSEAQNKIANTLKEQDFLVNPIVTVHIKNFTPQMITVLGEVSSPGQVAIPSGVKAIPVQQLIAMVGDFSDIARRNRVRIERKNASAGGSEVFFVDVEKMIESTKKDPNQKQLLIYPGDIIFVPRRVF